MEEEIVLVTHCPMCDTPKPGPSTCRKCGADLFSPEVQQAARAAAQRSAPAAPVYPPPPPPSAHAYQPPPPPMTSFYCQCGQPLAAVAGVAAVVCGRCGTTMGVPMAAPPMYAPPAYYPPAPASSANTVIIVIVVLVLVVALAYAAGVFGDDAKRYMGS